MIRNQGRQVIIECDSCEDTFNGEIDEEFAIVHAAAKREGWHTAKIAGQWLHGCKKCGRPS